MEKFTLLKCGKPLLLGKKLDRIYLTKVQEAGGVVSSRIVITAAKDLMMNVNKSNVG